LSTGTLMMVALGFDYSFGKIDHTIFGVAVPLVLCWAGWGRRFSFDAIRNPIRQGDQELPPQWPLRLMALIVGLAFFTAALAKFSGGWLSTSSQAVRGYFLKRYVINGDADGVAPILMAIHSPRAWELLDWFTVAFEAAILISVLVWPAFRVMLAVACVFHLSVLLMLDIAFSINVIAYGSFVYWSVICAPVRRLWGRPPPDMTRPVVRYALICGLFVAGVIIQFAPLVHPKFLLSAAIVVLGAVSAIVYLAMVAGRAVHRPKPT
ncbi:MAG: HTTM domain-containing protein, partial [Aeromicrobium sp.]